MIRGPYGAMVLLVAAAGLMLGGCRHFPRMDNQESIKPYERDMPDMPKGTVPFTGGDAVLVAKVGTVPNPVPASPAAVSAGKTYYGYYCRHCHGETGDSRTPVGDSYVPKPARLDTPRVQGFTDDELYRKMVLGVGHEPVMKSTVRPERRWYIVHYLRTLGRP